jgi:hypothetical protein
VPGTSTKNVITQYLARGSTITYKNADSKQTSVCGKALDGQQQLCWVAVVTSLGKKGYIPVGRGTFTDPFCSTNPITANQNCLLVDMCGESLAPGWPMVFPRVDIAIAFVLRFARQIQVVESMRMLFFQLTGASIMQSVLLAGRPCIYRLLHNLNVLDVYTPPGRLCIR